ncbi:MAG: DUF4145 domain-containing protein [Bryobacterales bacterium]|nr:DUF4145 domain-containing protein [Bryobacterales bacterium]
MVVYCKDCDRKVDAKVVGQHAYHDAAEGPPTRITLLQCLRCGHAVLVREEEIWEDSWTNPETVYPYGGGAPNPELPERLQSALQEARRCYQAKAYTATALLCRRTIETLCVDRGVKEQNLAAALAKMRDRNLIDGSLFEWADGLRLAGNRAAHDVTSDVSWEDARDLVEFTEALLEYVIVFRERFERFKARQSQPAAKQPAPAPQE